jgi:hypothetical protein
MHQHPLLLLLLLGMGAVACAYCMSHAGMNAHRGLGALCAFVLRVLGAKAKLLRALICRSLHVPLPDMSADALNAQRLAFRAARRAERRMSAVSTIHVWARLGCLACLLLSLMHSTGACERRSSSRGACFVGSGRAGFDADSTAC